MAGQVSASLTGHCCQTPCFSAFAVITAWVTLLYLVGLEGGSGRHKHWSDRTGEPRFGAGAKCRIWVNFCRNCQASGAAVPKRIAAIHGQVYNRLECAKRRHWVATRLSDRDQDHPKNAYR